MKTYTRLLALTLAVFCSVAAYGQDKFVGTWSFKEAKADPDKLVTAKNSEDMVIEKVTDEYYRAGRGRTNLLYKKINENTLFSNVSSDREITAVWLDNDTVEFTVIMKMEGMPPSKPAVVVWVRKK